MSTSKTTPTGGAGHAYAQNSQAPDLAAFALMVLAALDSGDITIEAQALDRLCPVLDDLFAWRDGVVLPVGNGADASGLEG